ncbi:flagellar protein FliO/FliZ [Franzmannia pantelleriensis]|uniref:Flagellar protein n=1 Tax=Franzmannia pantelleriensis TaxID=48727 RepID=A0A1G9MFU7_9GAMM|nr:flagellar biosynthetic protein FliO [Halomonas pantelleriensis]SDL73148.1 flagellar protein FliO/FliZ [Halomonas pantelleriensis]
MSDSVSTPAPTPQVDTSGLAALEGSVGTSDALLGMAALGKTAAALALVVAVIFLCSYLVKRLHPQGRLQGQHLKVVGSTTVGNRERVVIVDVEGTWLVLGVGGGQVNKLHECAAPVDASPLAPEHPEGNSFATRFASALKQNAGLGRGKGTR